MIFLPLSLDTMGIYIYGPSGVWKFHTSYVIIRRHYKLSSCIYLIPEPMVWKDDAFQHSRDHSDVYIIPRVGSNLFGYHPEEVINWFGKGFGFTALTIGSCSQTCFPFFGRTLDMSIV